MSNKSGLDAVPVFYCLMYLKITVCPWRKMNLIFGFKTFLKIFLIQIIVHN
jgi:hypothetical protein